MPTTNINIRTDSEVKAKATAILADLGLDMTTAFNVFLRQIINRRGIPFVIAQTPDIKAPKPGGWEGKIWMSDDFDEPLGDLNEYME
ncbi:MAG: type II toxin-antitoxin system RelB/DinJ family antitoxin [Synergistaceae bacterium]|nr:type II toxin-antitoxin system RelB/DinJ family antitoxin [Synergistaceae bacterium]